MELEENNELTNKQLLFKCFKIMCKNKDTCPIYKAYYNRFNKRYGMSDMNVMFNRYKILHSILSENYKLDIPKNEYECETEFYTIRSFFKGIKIFYSNLVK